MSRSRCELVTASTARRCQSVSSSAGDKTSRNDKQQLWSQFFCFVVARLPPESQPLARIFPRHCEREHCAARCFNIGINTRRKDTAEREERTFAQGYSRRILGQFTQPDVIRDGYRASFRFWPLSAHDESMRAWVEDLGSSVSMLPITLEACDVDLACSS